MPIMHSVRSCAEINGIIFLGMSVPFLIGDRISYKSYFKKYGDQVIRLVYPLITFKVLNKKHKMTIQEKLIITNIFKNAAHDYIDRFQVM